MTNVIELDSSRVGKYISQAIDTFINDPPRDDYDQGFLAALLIVATEGLNKKTDPKVQAAEKILGFTIQYS